MDLREWVKAVRVFPGRTDVWLPGDHATIKLELQQPPRDLGMRTFLLWVRNADQYVDEVSSLRSTFP